MRDVVDDADREMALRGRGLHVVVDRLHHGGAEFLGAETVAARQDFRHLAFFHASRAHIHIKRIAQGTRFLGPVEHGDDPGAGRDRRKEEILHERPVEPDLDQADLFALPGQVVDRFLDGLAGGPHGDHHTVGLRIADVIERPIAAPGQVADLLHGRIHHARNFQVVRICRLAALKVDIGILGRAPQLRPLRVGPSRPEFGNRIEVGQPRHVLVIDEGDLLDFVGGAEPVEEVHEGHTRFDRRQMGGETEIHHLLDRSRSDHRETRLAGGHDILMVAENRQGVGRDGPRRYVENPRQQLTRDLVHVRDHEQQALRGGERGGQRTGGERPVH